jgi:hypothetical protein
VIGFLFGVTAAGSAGYYYLLSEYNNASAALMLSVQELQESTNKVSKNKLTTYFLYNLYKLLFQVKDYARRIETVDRDVAKLKEAMATKKQLTDLKGDFRKLYVRRG